MPGECRAVARAACVRRAALATLGLLLAGAAPAQADIGAQFFSILKKYHPEPDQVEFARYYVYEPAHAEVIYEKVAGQEYPFIAILAAAKAAKNQKILPGGRRFEYGTCMIPIDTFNAIFAKSGEYVEKYGQEEHVKGYLHEQNEQGKQAASDKIAEYVPYWKDIPHICHFTFFTEFEKEAEIKRNLGEGFRTIKAAFADVSSGDLAGAIDKLSSTGIAGPLACEFADQVAYGGAVGKVPVLGKAARGVCASFAGSVIKGIGTATGAVVDATGAFVGDFACAALVGSCTKARSVDGFFNPNFETFVVNWTFSPPAQADAWAAGWYSVIQRERCLRIGGSGAGAQCDQGWAQVTASARATAVKLQEEPRLAYEQIYAPKLGALVSAPGPAAIATLALLDVTCAENLLTKYPWPGPQLTDHHNKVFRDLCQQARTRSDLGHGASFEARRAQLAAELKSKLDAACPTATPKGRSCPTYPALASCVAAYAAHGMERGAAKGTVCSLDRPQALAALAELAPRACAARVVPMVGLQATCPTYEAQAACVRTVNAVPGVDPGLSASCRVDKAAANRHAAAQILGRLNGPRSPAERRGRPQPCSLGEAVINCTDRALRQTCDALLAANGAIPRGALRCAFLQPVATTEMPDREPGGTVPPAGGAPVPPPVVDGSSAAAVVARNLERQGCKGFLGRPRDWLCTTDAGFRACEAYRTRSAVDACRRARP
jgi:hypothetical protein